MKLIATNGDKTFKVIPRQFISGAITVTLTSESTGAVITKTPTASTDVNYMSFTFGTLTEADFYTLEIKNGTVIIYKDRVFCTDQTVNQVNNDYYSVNDGVYNTENSFDNDYIIL